MRYKIHLALISMLLCSLCMAKPTPAQKAKKSACHVSFYKVLPALTISFGLGILTALQVEEFIQEHHRIQEESEAKIAVSDETLPQLPSATKNEAKPDEDDLHLPQ